MADAAVDTPTTALPQLGDLAGTTRRIRRHDGSGRYWPAGGGGHRPTAGRWPVRGLIEPTGALTAADIAAITAPDQETRAS